MDRVDFFFKQLVTEADLDLPFDAAESADQHIVADLGFVGVVSGMGVTQSSTPGMSAQVAAGVAYDAAGQRIYLPTTQQVNLALDSNGVSTAVGNSGNSKVLSVFAQFARNNTDQRSDGNSQPVYFKRLESFSLIVRQGAEALDGTEVAAPLEADKILLADIKRTFGQTTVLDANINPAAYSNRREDAFVGAASPLGAFRVGSIRDVIAALRGSLVESIITPGSSLSGTSSDYNPTGLLTSKNAVVRANLSAAAALRSIEAPASALNLRIKIFNISAFTLTLNHEDGAATAAKRILCPGSANFAVRANGFASLWYDVTSSRWRVEAP